MDTEQNNIEVVDNQEEKKQSVGSSSIVCILGMIAGLIVALLGVTTGEISNLPRRIDYENVREVRFGADFYTESHSATAAAANNIGELIDVVDDSSMQMMENLGAVLSVLSLIPISIGIFIIFYFLLQLTKIKANN